jgi:hypothetical protein
MMALYPMYVCYLGDVAPIHKGYTLSLVLAIHNGYVRILFDGLQ